MSKKIKYVELEVKAIQGKDDVIKGLFYGMVFNPSAELVRLYLGKATSAYVSYKAYTVISMTIVQLGDIRKQTFFRATIEDQNLAQLKIKETMLELRAENMCNEKYEVDIKQYKDVPSEYALETVQTTSSFGGTIFKPGNFKPHVPAAAAVPAVIYGKPVVKPVTEADLVTFIQRKGKLPAPETLKDLKKKAKLISEGKYVAAPIPAVKEVAEPPEAPLPGATKALNSFVDGFLDDAGIGRDDSYHRHWD